MNREVTFTLCERDLRHAGRLHIIRSFTGGVSRATLIYRWVSLWFVATFVAAAISLTYNIAVYVTVEASLFRASIYGLVFAVLCGVGGLGVPLLLTELGNRRCFRQDELYRRPMTVKWNDEAYEVDLHGNYSRCLWRDYWKQLEDNDYFLFFIHNNIYQILPKRVLTQEQIEDIQRVLSANPGRSIVRSSEPE